MTAVLTAAGLQRRFGGVRALDGVDVTVDAGEVVAVVGPNGSGKSTLLGVLAGLVRPDAGTVHLDGSDVTTAPPGRRARRGLTRTFQDGRLLDRLAAVENVELGLLTASPGRRRPGRRTRRRLAVEALATVGLADRWEQRAATLSHGQRRRVEIARALVGRPRLLLLDEPTAGLTPEDVEAVADLIGGAAERGAAVLVVEHDLDVVGRLARRVVVLDRGTVSAAGPPAEVLGTAAVRHLLGVATLEPDA